MNFILRLSIFSVHSYTLESLHIDEIRDSPKRLAGAALLKHERKVKRNKE